MSLFFILSDQMASWCLPPKRDHNNTLSVGPRPTKAKDLNEPEQCTIKNASEYKPRA